MLSPLPAPTDFPAWKTWKSENENEPFSGNCWERVAAPWLVSPHPKSQTLHWVPASHCPSRAESAFWGPAHPACIPPVPPYPKIPFAHPRGGVGDRGRGFPSVMTVALGSHWIWVATRGENSQTPLCKLVYLGGRGWGGLVPAFCTGRVRLAAACRQGPDGWGWGRRAEPGGHRGTPDPARGSAGPWGLCWGFRPRPRVLQGWDGGTRGCHGCLPTLMHSPP